MNILLTEIRALALELHELPAAAGDSSGEFTRLLRRELLDAGQQEFQDIEFKWIYSDFKFPAPAPGGAAQIPAADAWQEFLARDPVRVTTETDPLETVTAAPAALVPLSTTVTESPLTAAALAPGEVLPPGGISLPQVVPRQAQTHPRPLIPELTPAAVPLAQNAAAAASTGARYAAAPSAVAAQPPADVADAIAALAPGAYKPRPAAAGTPPVGPQAATVTAATMVSAGSPAEQAPANLTAAGRTQADRAPLPLGAAPEKRTASAAGEQAAAAQRPPAEAVAPRPGVAPPALVNGAGTETAPANRAAPAADLASAADADKTRPALERISNPARIGTAPDDSTAAVARAALEAAASRHVAEPVAVPKSALEAREAGALTSQQVKSGVDNALSEALPGRAPDVAVTGTTATQVTPTAAPQAAALAIGSAIAPAPAFAAAPQPEVLTLLRQADAGEWGNSLGERVNYMINQKQNSATIRLDPPTLGKLEVQVRIADDATTITIQTQHAQARDLIESASYRLRDFLQESGYQNVNVDVSQRQDQQQARNQAAPDDDGAQQDDERPDADFDASPQQRRQQLLQGDGLLDTFA